MLCILQKSSPEPIKKCGAFPSSHFSLVVKAVPGGPACVQSIELLKCSDFSWHHFGVCLRRKPSSQSRPGRSSLNGFSNSFSLIKSWIMAFTSSLAKAPAPLSKDYEAFLQALALGMVIKQFVVLGCVSIGISFLTLRSKDFCLSTP
ncbi:hypothetical protein RRG08_045537 [Elysia crispata]|uniref:Uncharacterized protein n=1 Tax=Elysia crispata TaxID=231223 RepID=A0AAE0ZG73_9GAST|nr:hypothetical protein RRG08_045537 [Elysia crispata]